MGATTGIAWTDRTWNGIIGCTRVSEGCRHCYAEQMAATKFKRFLGGPVWGAANPRYETRAELWKQPLRWARKARQTGERIRVFGNSLFDLFENHPTVNKVRPRIWELVDQTRDVLTWQFCTKRPERIADCLPATWGTFWGNVWLGTTVESSDHADRVGHLRAVGVAVRFLSIEPALGPVHHAIDLDGIDWVLWGGESGKGWRPADHQWARDLLAKCRANETAFFFKQSAGPRSGMGDWLDGVEIKEFPIPRVPTRH